jgi:hypothetical protein
MLELHDNKLEARTEAVEKVLIDRDLFLTEGWPLP